MLKNKVQLFLLLLVHTNYIVHCLEGYEECHSIDCVHTSAFALERIAKKLNPCDDFYKFSCGSLKDNTYTQEEKIQITTHTVIDEKLEEQVFRILDTNIGEEDEKFWPNFAAKRFFQNCYKDQADGTERENNEAQQLFKLIEDMGGWPMMNKSWNKGNKEEDWSMRKMILKIHEFADMRENFDNISFSENQNSVNVDKANIKQHSGDDDDDDESEEYIENEKKLLDSYPELVFTIAKAFCETLGNETSHSRCKITENTKNDIYEALELGIALNLILNGNYFQPRSALNRTRQKELADELEDIKWLEIFHRFPFKKSQSHIVNKEISVYDNFNNLKIHFKPRDFANYAIIKFVDFAIPFLNIKNITEEIHDFQNKVLDTKDKEQKWRTCTQSTIKYATVATGSMYVKKHFDIELKEKVSIMVNEIITTMKKRVEESPWMESDDKAKFFKKINDLTIHMGYDEKLLNDNALVEYYENLISKIKNDTSNYLKFGVQLSVHQAYNTFRRKFRNFKDWTVYARPTISRSLFNQNDNTIYFSAAFLQSPNFHDERPIAMNYGGIGTIIAHELVHSFDYFYQQELKQNINGENDYQMNLECIIKQYSNFNDEDSGMKLDGNRTNIEDIADNIGVSLAYQTYIDVVERNLKDNKREETLIAFKDYNPKQLFWISFAQFYCSVHRKGYNKKQLEQAEAIHTLNEFRVKGPLQNSKQFAKDFNCKEGTVMNPDSKCSIW